MGRVPADLAAELRDQLGLRRAVETGTYSGEGARLFAGPPPPPHDPTHWPTLVDVIDAIRAARPDHHVTVLADQVIGVPGRAKPAVDHFGQRVTEPPKPSLVG